MPKNLLTNQPLVVLPQPDIPEKIVMVQQPVITQQLAVPQQLPNLPNPQQLLPSSPITFTRADPIDNALLNFPLM